MEERDDQHVDSGLVWASQPGPLRKPVLVAGFEGWNDAADAASGAAAWLTEHGDTTPVASIDPEPYFDFQTRRPHIEIANGVPQSITWPENLFSTVGLDQRDVVVLRGVEPSYRWQAFCDTILSVAKRTSCEMIVTFGALLADVPHTRAARITGVVTDPALIGTLGLTPSRYEGPTGIVGALHGHCQQAGVPSVSLWAPVPHYVAAPPNPPATFGLLERLGNLLGIDLDLDHLEKTAQGWREKVDDVAASDDDVRGYVRGLEERYDNDVASDASWGAHLPTGDELAREVERYLRDEGGRDT